MAWSSFRHEFGGRSGAARQGDRAEPSTVGKRTLVQMLEATMPAQPSGEAPGPAPGEIQQIAAQGFTGAAQPLPHLDRIQASFGRHTVTGVQAHVGGAAAEAAGSMGAAAYAMGSSVAFGQAPDLHTAAHEAAHVVQQRAGVHFAGGVGKAGDAHERHADAVADRVVQGRSSEDLLDAYTGGGGPAVQHRTIAAAVYNTYDASKLRASTKGMLEAAQYEDEAIALFDAVRAVKETMERLKDDPFVGSKATASLGGVNANAMIVILAKNAITRDVDAIEAAYTAAVSGLGAPAVPKGLPIRERLQATARAQLAQDATVLAQTDPAVARTRAEIAKARVALAAIQGVVTPLSDEADRLRKAKQTYQGNVAALHQARGEQVEERAVDLGVKVPDLDTSYREAEGHADHSQWLAAEKRSSDGRSELDALKRGVAKAERDKDEYLATRSELKQLTRLRGSFTDLRILDPQLVAAEALAEQAQEHYEHQRWEAAVSTANKAAKLLPDLNELVKSFDAYRSGAKPKLLAGTINQVHDQLVARGAYTNKQALDSLEATYKDQCAVTRENWLRHLGIAGDNVIGAADDHWTKFNNSIPPGLVSLRVDVDDADTLCAKLFAAVASNLQLHATRVVAGERYHRYWDGTESPNIAIDDLENTQPAAFAQLVARYNVMVQALTNGVGTAKADHGRVAGNDRGQQITITLV